MSVASVVFKCSVFPKQRKKINSSSRSIYVTWKTVICLHIDAVLAKKSQYFKFSSCPPVSQTSQSQAEFQAALSTYMDFDLKLSCFNWSPFQVTSSFSFRSRVLTLERLYVGSDISAIQIVLQNSHKGTSWTLFPYSCMYNSTIEMVIMYMTLHPNKSGEAFCIKWADTLYKGWKFKALKSQGCLLQSHAVWKFCLVAV